MQKLLVSKAKTNLPTVVRLQQGARDMFLNNSLIEHGICNGTIGIVTDLDNNQTNIQVAFCIRGAIVHKWITKQTATFTITAKGHQEHNFHCKLILFNSP